MGERIRIKLPRSDVVGVGCRVKRMDSSGVFYGLQRVVVEGFKIIGIYSNYNSLQVSTVNHA